ncbi:MAG TPA: lamin tail domain-containing protein, partial [Pyrinomonadaceae bacterium]
MPTLPLSGRRPASARRQLLAVLTAAFLAFQQFILLAPAAHAQASRPRKADKATVTKATPVAKKAPAATLDEPGLPGAPSTSIVISQVYGGAGCGTAGCSTYKNDYIELFNRGSAAQSLNGWSVQYASATGTAWQVTNLTNVTLQPGQYYLVAEGAGPNGVNNIPTADVTGTIAMSATSAKVAVVNTTTALSGQCGNGAATTLPASVLDFVGYGANANCNDAGATTGGTGNAPAPSTTTADLRAANGCTDTDNNASDFTATTPNPRNTSTAANVCSAPVDNAPTVTGTVPADNATGVAVTSNISVTFSEPVTATASSFQINCATSGTHAFTPSGGPTTFTLDPTTDFTQGEVCTVTVFAAQVTDQDGTPNQMAADYVFDFTVVNSTPVAIHDIQGSGTSSPLAGQTVTTSGVVTLLKTGSNAGAGAASGFFLQAPDAGADADPNTSEGIFVFTSSVPTVAVGDAINVTGTVVEFNGMTEISPVSSVSVNSTGNALPTPVTLTTTILDPAASPAQPQLEKYEGMRMGGTLRTVAPNDNFFDVDTVLSTVARPMREPGIPVSLPVPPDPTTGTPDCCIPRWDENPERLKVDTNGRAGAANTPYTSNVTFTNLSGPLDFAFGEYRLVADAAPSASAGMPLTSVGPPEESEFTVASYNIENFNNNATQRQKAASTVRTLLFNPDIIGAIEIDDLAHLQALADQIDADTAGDPDPTQYEAYLEEGNREGGGDLDQNVGFLVNTARVQVNGVTQERKDETYTPPGGSETFLHDRPPLVLDATVDPSGPSPQRVLVVVNHLRSFICIDADVNPAEAAQCSGGAADGPRVRAKRKAQAESLADLLNDLQTANPGVPVMSVGDYNAFEFNNGYDDPVSVIKGNPRPDDQIVVDQSPDLVNPDFVNLIETLPALDRYSFIFEGTPQALDHHLVNAAARARNTRIMIARVNADFPEAPAATYASNTATPARNSDHDPVVSYYRLGASQAAGSLIISEFRFRGPGATEGGGELGPVSGDDSGGPNAPGTAQDNDEFVEIYNNTDSAITVQTLDGSAGFSLVASDGVTRFIIPNGTVIDARGYFLGVNLDGYSLAAYATPDDVLLPSDTSTTVGGYTLDIPDGSGLALFSTAEPTNYTLANRLDAAGYATVDPLYREGAGFPAAGAEATSDLEHSFVRRVCVFGGAGCGPFLPKDSGENGADFVVVNTDAAP